MAKEKKEVAGKEIVLSSAAIVEAGPKALQPTNTTPSQFIEMALTNGLSIEHLEKLMNLQERWEAKQATKSFFEALTKFQYLCPVIEKKKLVSFGTTSYKHAELSEIDAAIKEAMQEVGLSKRWEIEDSPSELKVTAIITHLSGHSESSTMSAGKDQSGGKNDIQARASSITYLQRYTLVAALGITTASEDVDATDAGRGPEKQPAKPAAQKPAQQPANLPKDAEIKKAKNLFELRALWFQFPEETRKEKEPLFSAHKADLKKLLALPAEECSVFELIDQIKCIDSADEMNNYLLKNQQYLDDNFGSDANVKRAFEETQAYLKKLKKPKAEA